MVKPVPAVLALAISAALAGTTVNAQEIAIQDKADELEVIVVSGTRTPKPLKDVAGSISVVTEEDIDRQVVTDMNQLFQYDPSVKVTGGAGKAQNIVVRGMGSDRILMIKDGMRMNEGYGANGLNDIVGRGFVETDILKQVEVAKGASSSLYGADALGGIVVFTTKDARDYLDEGDSFGGKVSLGYVENGKQANGSVTLAHRAGSFEHMLNMVKRDGEEQQNYNESDSPFDIESNSLFYKARYDINSDNYFTFSADFWRQDVDGQSADGLLTYFRGLAKYGYNVVTENTQGGKSSDAYQLRFVSETATSLYDTLNMSLYSNHTQEESQEYGQLDINAPMFGVVEIRDMWKTANYEQKTLGFLSNATKALNDTHTLGYGLDVETTESVRSVHEYREVEGNVTKDTRTDKFPKNNTLRAGLFINDEITLLNDKLIITPGARFDYYEMDPNGILKIDGTAFSKIDESNISLNFGALYHINDELSAYVQYGQGFKVPAYDLAYLEHYNQTSSSYAYQVLPSDDLKPEESDTYEIGLRGNFDNFAFTSAIYYNKFDNFLATTLLSSQAINNPDGSFSHTLDTYSYENIDSVTIKGAELGLTYYISDDLNLFANAAYTDGKNDNTGDYLTSISPLSGVFGASYEWSELTTQVVANWSERMTKVNEGATEVAGYVSVDWLVQYQATDALSFNLSVKNLFDTEYVDYTNVAGHGEDSDIYNQASAGRNFSAKISYSF